MLPPKSVKPIRVVPRVTFRKPCAGSVRPSSQGSVEASRELGLILLRGDGVAKDPDQAAVLLREAAENGDAEAEAALGVMYAYGDGVQQNWPLAVEWSRRAAEQDDPWGEANLGLYLRRRA